MTQISISIRDVKEKIQIELFRSVNVFEGFDSYLHRVIVPMFETHVPEAYTIRCSLSGAKIGRYLTNEIALTIRQSADALQLARYNDLLYSFKPKDFIESVEDLIEEVTGRALLLARRAPSISGAKGRLAIDTLSRPRQLMILLNQFLFDSGMFREKFAGLDDLQFRLRKAMRLADVIEAEWDGDLNAEGGNHFEDLYSALVELDAKWLIKSLKFTEKEVVALKKHRESNILDIKSLRAFVWSMVAYRDVHVDMDLITNRWTQNAYREVSANSFNATQDPKNSNFSDKNDGPSNRHIKNPKTGTAKKTASKSKDVNRDMFSSLLAGAFGGNKL